MIDILKELSQIAGYLTGLMAFFALIIPKSRNFLVKWLRKNLEIDKVNKSLEVEIEKSHDREKAIEAFRESKMAGNKGVSVQRIYRESC